MPPNHAERRGVLFLVAAVLTFGSIPLFLKHFTAFLDAWTVNGLRYGMAALLWLPFVIRLRGSAPPGRNIWRDAVPPTIVNVVGQVGWALAPYHNDASVIGFVGRASFLFSMVVGFTLLPQERAVARRPLFWLGSAAIAVGLYGMYRSGVQQGSTSFPGMAILLGTAASWGVYGVLVRRHVEGYDVRLSFGVISLYTTGALWIAMFAFGQWPKALHLPLGLWGLLAASAILGIALSHVLLYRSIHTLGPVVTEGGLCACPFLTALGAVVVLKEKMGPAQWLGGSLLALGCVCLVVSKCTVHRPTGDEAATADTA